MAATLRELLAQVPLVSEGRRVTVTVFDHGGDHVRQVTFRPSEAGLQEDRVIRDMHPLTGQRLDLWRLKNFDGTRLPSSENTYLFHCVAKDNPADERLVALAEIRDVNPLRDATGQVTAFPAVERALAACLDSIRRYQAQQGGQRLDANRIFLYVWPTIEVSLAELGDFARSTAPLTAGAGLEEIMLLGRLQREPDLGPQDVALLFSYSPRTGVRVSVTEPPTEPLPPLDAYTQKVRRSRARGTVYPYELIPQLTGAGGTFTEYDLDADGRLAPVERPPGRNTGRDRRRSGLDPDHPLPRGYDPGGVVRRPDEGAGLGRRAGVRAGDRGPRPRRGDAGSGRVVRAVLRGPKISMDSGTENMDWVARALRRLITFTQAGGEVNVVVAGINVGAQPYWNAEATMLMHTKGILVMTPDSAMVLTGKQSLDYSGGVSAEDNFGIGGYDRVMGPNGQAQYWAPNLTAACDRHPVRALRPRLRRTRGVLAPTGRDQGPGRP